MFKRTNNLRKALAIVLALCMIPTVAFAEETATEVAITSATVNEAEGTVTIAGTISDADAEVTILAVRGGQAYDDEALAAYTDEDLGEDVVYIDQKAATEGAFSFTFVPRADATIGGIITAFVGGENVSAVAYTSVEALVKAPTLALVTENWEFGDDLVFSVTGSDADAWFERVGTVTVTLNGEEVSVDLDDVTFADGELAIANLGEGTVTKVVLKAAADKKLFKDARWESEEGITAVAKTPGTASDLALVGDEAIAIALEDANEWISNIGAESVSITKGGEAVEGFEYAISDGVLTITGITAPKTGVDTYVVSIAAPKFAVVTADVVITAETTAAKNALVAPEVVYSDSEFETADPAWPEDGTPDDAQALFGKASVTLPAAVEGSDAVISWTIDEIAVEAGVVELARAASDAAEPKTAYEAVATIVYGDDADTTETVSYTLTVNQINVKGIEVAITLAKIAVDAVVDATVTVDGAEAAADGAVFTAEAVADGDHTVVVARPGFVTLTFTLTVADGAVAAVDSVRAEDITAEGFTVNMVAGDIYVDGKVDGMDASALYAAWRATTENVELYNIAADIDGSGEVNGLDASALYAEWRFGY